MKSLGYIRKLGRVSIPSGIREALDITSEAQMEIYMMGEMVAIKKHKPGCSICGDEKSSTYYIMNGDKRICWRCAEKLREMMDEDPEYDK